MKAFVSTRPLGLSSVVALALAGIGAQSAGAGIVYSGVLNITPSTSNVYIDFDTVSTSTTSIAGFDLRVSTNFGSTGFSGPSLFVVRRNNNPPFLAASTASLPSGFIIGPSPAAPFNFGFSTATGGTTEQGAPLGGGTSQGAWPLGANGIVGFSFQDSVGNLRYGWARITLGQQPSDVFTLVDFAYENTGGTIAAGAIPTPGAAALLGVGALAGLRRRRRA
jgi:MYXO-CTERM domain-containing protein